jgi:hypothetical protein
MIIIVARYDENVEWTREFPNVVIYNKGESLDDGYSYNEVFLNNVGRSCHTYYKYICDNYDNLENYTIFLEGNPFENSPNVILNLNIYLNKNNCNPLYYFNYDVFNFEFEFLSKDIRNSTLDLECKQYLQCENIHKTWERVFGETCDVNNECVYGAGGQFIVSKNKILKRPKEFYENIVKILEYTTNPLEGYDIERFHKYIFS